MEEIKGAGFKIKVVEQSGVTLKRIIQRLDPFRKKNVITLIVWSVALVGGKGLAEVPVLLVSWYVNFAATRNTPEFWNSENKIRWRHSWEKHGGNVLEFTMNTL